MVQPDRSGGSRNFCGTDLARNSLWCGYPQHQQEGLLRMVEVRIAEHEDFGGRLTAMRLWLDDHRFEPSIFTYFYLDPGMLLRVSFSVDQEADAFAAEFGGLLVHRPGVADPLGAVV
jgi:hypothetical protein